MDCIFSSNERNFVKMRHSQKGHRILQFWAHPTPSRLTLLLRFKPTVLTIGSTCKTTSPCSTWTTPLTFRPFILTLPRSASLLLGLIGYGMGCIKTASSQPFTGVVFRSFRCHSILLRSVRRDWGKAGWEMGSYFMRKISFVLEGRGRERTLVMGMEGHR